MEVSRRAARRARRNEDELALQRALGFEPRTSVELYAPSMLMTFKDLNVAQIAEALAGGSPLRSGFEAARVHGGKAQEVEMARVIRAFHFDRFEDPATRGLTADDKKAVLLRDHLTATNVEELLGAAAGKSTREVQEMLARRAPRPDVPATLTKVLTPLDLPLTTSVEAAPASGPARPTLPARIEPIAEDRYKLQLTASRELRDKLERARDLMMHANPRGDLAVVVERALDALIERLEKARCAKAKRPREPVETAKTKRGYITRDSRREVFERDGEQCTYVSADGERCAARAWLELDHVVPRAKGGSDESENLRVRCRSHNHLYAEECFGKAHVVARIDFRHRKPDVDLAQRGLVDLGFKPREATRALDLVHERHASDAAPLATETILREALSALAR